MAVAKYLGVVLLVLTVCVTTAASDGMTQRNIQVYQSLLDSLMKRLAAENCQISEISGLKHLVKRSLSAADDDYHLKLIQHDYNFLSDELQKCRAAKTPTLPAAIPKECLGAVNLTEDWRSNYTTGFSNPAAFNCDTNDMKQQGRPWFRFTSGAGNRLVDRCISPNSCGTHGPIWSDDTTPKLVGVVTPYRMYGSTGSNCKLFTFRASIIKCSDRVLDFVYRYEDIEYCPFGFCGMKDSM